MPLSPLDWSGAPFLALYLALLVLAALTSAVAPGLHRPTGRAQAVSDPGQLAWLAGGRARWVDATVAFRLSAGTLRMSKRGYFAAGEGPEIGWSGLDRQLAGEAAGVERGLVRAGLLADVDDLARLRRWAAGPFMALAAFGAVKLGVGLWRERPVGYLAALLVLTLVLAAVRWAGVDRRTAAGRDAFARARDTHQRLRRAPMADEMGLGVALFGTAVLAGSAHAGYHQYRTSSSDGGAGGDGGGDGGGGGCGGGCGGCGS